MVGIGADLGDRLGAWLNTRHPWVMTLTGTLFFLITGGVAALAVDIAVRSRGRLQVLCASIVAARLLPQSVFAVIQWVQDVRDPRRRGAKAERAMTMAYRK